MGHIACFPDQKEELSFKGLQCQKMARNISEESTTLRYHSPAQYSSRSCNTISITFRHQKIVSIIYFNNIRFKLNIGLYFSRVYNTRRLPAYCTLRVYDTRRSLRCYSRGNNVIKTSGQHPSRSSYMRRPGLYPSRCFDTRRTPVFCSSRC
jgi:hypothetical protein